MRYVVSDDLSPEKIRQLLNHWQMNDRVKLKHKFDYYNGKQKILNKTEGIESAEVNLEEKNAKIQYNEERINQFLSQMEEAYQDHLRKEGNV